VTLLAVGHGTRDPAGVATIRALLKRVRALRPGLTVAESYAEIAEPSLENALGGARLILRRYDETARWTPMTYRAARSPAGEPAPRTSRRSATRCSPAEQRLFRAGRPARPDSR
jgi:hypothetical protein